MTDSNLTDLFFRMFGGFFKQAIAIWWVWLIVIIVALLTQILPAIINKKSGNEKSEEKCPKCGGDLIEKQKYGRFLACSNYPNCRFTKKIN